MREAVAREGGAGGLPKFPNLGRSPEGVGVGRVSAKRFRAICAMALTATVSAASRKVRRLPTQ